MTKWRNWRGSRDGLRHIFRDHIDRFNRVYVYTVLDHVSRSGMMRVVSAFVMDTDTKGLPFPVCIAREVKIGGCGFDAGFHLAYSLFREAFRGDSDPRYQDALVHSWL